MGRGCVEVYTSIAMLLFVFFGGSHLCACTLLNFFDVQQYPFFANFVVLDSQGLLLLCLHPSATMSHLIADYFVLFGSSSVVVKPAAGYGLTPLLWWIALVRKPDVGDAGVGTLVPAADCCLRRRGQHLP